MSGVTQFRRKARIAISDIRLQGALEGATQKFRTGRTAALADLPDAGALRDHFKAIRQATIAQLADHLETFERNAQASGAQVHWAADGDEACRIITGIAQQHGVKLTTKSKSMTSEEIGLNDALADAGVEPVETDLGEWIVQLAGEPPSHIVGPALHKTRQQVAELLSKEAGKELDADDIPLLTAEARRMLRQKFLDAGLGISGANIGVAESGSIVLVTNEGNGRLVTSAPPVHIALMGIEKIAPTWDDAAVWLSLLARSATGQPLSVYTSVVTGPAKSDDIDGPQEVHIVLLDNGRSKLLNTPFEEVLQCIRCGACLNVCPVYRAAGGHSYGSHYSGPIGAVISPLLFGLEKHAALPQASTLCGACLDECPSRIDLPRMLLALRAEEVESGLIPLPERLLERAAARVMGNHRLLSAAGTGLRLGQIPLAQGETLNIPRRFNPAQDRRLPALPKKSFRQMWRDGDLDE